MTNEMFPDLMAPNPASHLIWVVAGLLFAMLGVILLVEVVDWVRSALRRLRGSDAPADGGGDERWTFHEPSTELHRRGFHRVEPYRRSWYEARPNEPRDHRRRPG